MELGQHEAALQDLQRQLALNSEEATTHFNVAICYRNIGQTNSALQSINTAIEQSPATGVFYAFRSAVYTDLGQTALAQADAQRAQSLGNGAPQ